MKKAVLTAVLTSICIATLATCHPTVLDDLGSFEKFHQAQQDHDTQYGRSQFTADITADFNKSPVVYIPGLVSSQLDAKDKRLLVNTFLPNPCYTSGKFKKSWLDPFRFLFCSEELELEYDSTMNTYRNLSGIEIAVPHFGDDVAFHTYQKLVDYLQNVHGYTQKNVRLAPYDWRLAPRELERVGYYHALKSLIEEMYYDNNHTPVSVVVVSYGGPVSLYFLTSGIVSQSWKDKYIGNYITIGGAWSGGNFLLQMLISSRLGLGEKILPIPPPGIIGDALAKLLRPLFRSFQSTYYLLPHASLWKDTVLVETPNRKYTTKDYEKLFRDIGFPQGYDMYRGIEDIVMWPPPHPGVPTHCFYSTGVPTPEIFKYTKDFPEDTEPVAEYGEEGDGQVSREGGEVCLQWAGDSHGYPFQAHHYRGIHHVDLFQDDGVLKAIGEIVNPKTKSY